jgi:hypothetical protein
VRLEAGLALVVAPGESRRARGATEIADLDHLERKAPDARQGLRVVLALPVSVNPHYREAVLPEQQRREGVDDDAREPVGSARSAHSQRHVPVSLLRPNEGHRGPRIVDATVEVERARVVLRAPVVGRAALEILVTVTVEDRATAEARPECALLWPEARVGTSRLREGERVRGIDRDDVRHGSRPASGPRREGSIDETTTRGSRGRCRNGTRHPRGPRRVLAVLAHAPGFIREHDGNVSDVATRPAVILILLIQQTIQAPPEQPLEETGHR